MKRAKSLVATAVFATCGALPFAALSQTGGAAAGIEGGSTRHDTQSQGTQAATARTDTGATAGTAQGATATGTAGTSGTTGSTDTTGTTGTTGTTRSTLDAQEGSSATRSTTTTGPAYGPTGAVGGAAETGSTAATAGGAGTTGATGATGLSPTARDREASVLGQQQPSRGLLPGTTAGYAGANLGWSRWSTPCVGGFDCENGSVAGKIYTGGMFTNTFGAELGYVHMGSVDRGGGTDRAHGINLSVVGNLPFEQFNAFAKVGTTYGFTRTNYAPNSGLASGSKDGFGLSYGLGLGMNLTSTTQLVAEWERHNFRFTSGNDSVHMFSIGARVLF